MRKDLVYLLLPLALAACTESIGGAMDDTPEGKYAGYRVTGSINPIQVTSRVVDGEVETKFQENDVMLIGWNASGSGTYNGYAYTYNDEKFSPTDGNPASLWTALEKETGTVDVYAWYRKNGEQTVIPVGNTLSVTTDQSTEAQYTSNIYLAAHTICSSSTTSLEFGFSHLMARLKFSIDFNDKSISTSEVQRAVVKTRLYISGTLQPTGAGTEKNLQVVDVESSGSLEEVTMLTKGDNNYHIDCTCLLPPQTLTTTNHSITITLDNGKEYICTLGKSLTLKAGEEAKVPIEISVGGTSVYDPVVTIVPQTLKSSYSGNRLITGNSDKTITIYDKQADGSWGAPAYVYASKASGEHLKIARNYFNCIDICGDYAGVGVSKRNGGSSESDDIVYLLRKDKTTGKWYVAQTNANKSGYSLAVNENFIIYGGSGTGCTAIAIDKNDGFSTQSSYFDIGTYKLCIADNDVFCNGSVVYKLNLGSNGKPAYSKIASLGSTRNFTDGKKVITQKGDGDNNTNIITIYNIETGRNETIDYPIVAGSGLPVVIYDKYALAGFEAKRLVLYYFDGNRWRRLGAYDDDQSFLKILQRYAPSDQINDLTFLDGNLLMMKGTKVTIVSEGTTYFVENVDQIVKRYLQDNPLTD